MTPGEYQIQDGDIELCAGRERIELDVSNTGDRPGNREIYGFRQEVMGKLEGKA